MQRCLSLAEKALGNTHPNPLVGALVVYQNKIIGEGWHLRAGEAHAEVNAINQVENSSLFPKTTLYVNLEPCSHFGKTPPCADLIIKSGMKKVVIASRDPNPQVAGRGIERLKNAGVEVIENVLKEEAEFLNRRFYTFHQKNRPYIILKWAQTEDGFIAPFKKETKQPFWISNELVKQKVHQWRSQETSILVGVQTVVDDNPVLSTREWPGKNPLRLILDPSNRITKNATVLTDELPAVLLNHHNPNSISRTQKEHFSLNPFKLEKLMEFSYQRKLLSLFVEGGQKTLNSFIESNLWDEARVITAPSKLTKGVKAPLLNIDFNKEEAVSDNLIRTYFS
ncbi:MAG: Riboflavin biosynthesis protein RibD [uncultured Bacteroidota bacterium]|nr:MAG: Riboflavin biosynthesis protein RibD [uncultured Bacteroidetes bacterium]